MKISDKVSIRTNIKKTIKSFATFFMANILSLFVFSSLMLTSMLITSFGINDSSSALVDLSSIACSNIAKENYYNKVHIETALAYSSNGSLEQIKSYNTEIFTRSNRLANNSFIKYSSAAFQTRNNFYNIPISYATSERIFATFNFSFLNSNLDVMSITPSTSSEIAKYYTTTKIVDGEVVDNYKMTRLRMETIDLFLMFPKEKISTGIPVFIPDYIAERLVVENDSLSTLKDCLGLEGTVLVDGVKSNIFIKNIIVTSPKESDQTDLEDLDFSSSNVRFANFFKELYGDYVMIFHSNMYATNRCLNCADFDSEYFKIKSFFINDLPLVYSDECNSSIYHFEKEDTDYVLSVNDDITQTINEALAKNFQNGHFSYFDGNLLAIVTGLLLFVGSVFYFIFIHFYKKTGLNTVNGWIFVYCFLPIVILNILLLPFLFAFSSNHIFVGFSFASLSVVSLILTVITLLITVIVYFLKKGALIE